MISEDKKYILGLVQKYYKCNLKLVSNTCKEVYAQEFLIEDHAKKVENFCKKNNILVSFRKAGKSTLDRIEEGCPCKGHDILDKTIKEKNGMRTYKISDKDFNEYVGLVGHPDSQGNLVQIWALDSENKATLLNLGDINGNIKQCFTGDYDMEDLFRAKPGDKVYSRILPGTDENSIIDQLNQIMFQVYPNRPKVPATTRSREWPYSFIRHGAQTSYISYLLSNDGKDELRKIMNYYKKSDTESLPMQGKVVCIDSPICMFDNQGIFILDNLDKVYSYYSQRSMLDHIPYYYFIDDLLQKINDVDKKHVLEIIKPISNLLLYVSNL